LLTPFSISAPSGY